MFIPLQAKPTAKLQPQRLGNACERLSTFHHHHFHFDYFLARPRTFSTIFPPLNQHVFQSFNHPLWEDSKKLVVHLANRYKERLVFFPSSAVHVESNRVYCEAFDVRFLITSLFVSYSMGKIIVDICDKFPRMLKK